MHISNFRPVKRVLDCVHILALVRKTVDVELAMVGDGPLRAPAEELARLFAPNHRRRHQEQLAPGWGPRQAFAKRSTDGHGGRVSVEKSFTGSRPVVFIRPSTALI